MWKTKRIEKRRYENYSNFKDSTLLSAKILSLIMSQLTQLMMLWIFHIFAPPTIFFY